MQRITLKRAFEVDGATLGVLAAPGIELLTLELPWRNNEKLRSCIPLGKYLIQRHRSPNFGECFEVIGVPNRDDILFHAGNVPSDTHGCILLGLQYGRLNNKPAVLSSRKAVARFMAALDATNEAHFEVL